MCIHTHAAISLGHQHCESTYYKYALWVRFSSDGLKRMAITGVTIKVLWGIVFTTNLGLPCRKLDKFTGVYMQKKGSTSFMLAYQYNDTWHIIIMHPSFLYSLPISFASLLWINCYLGSHMSFLLTIWSLSWNYNLLFKASVCQTMNMTSYGSQSYHCSRKPCQDFPHIKVIILCRR